MKRLFIITLMVLLLMFVLVAPAAYAVLERVGPVNNDPSVGDFPSWYQDTTGLALEFCAPQNQLEVDGGWCLLLPGDVPVVPEVFPGQFFDEHFWFAADALIGADRLDGIRAHLVLALEAAFNAGVTPGGQISFSRIRVRLDNVPVTGTYRFIHPYGEELVDGIAGTRIFFTDDVGVVVGNFTGALQSRLGPYLLPSNTPGGPELPAVTGPVPGKLYIASPDRVGPVTGSPLPNFIDSTGASRNHNIFRVEGPAGSNLGGPGIDFMETTGFNLMGRVFQGEIPGRVTVDRASYTRSGTEQKVDVYATAFPTTQGRLPAAPLTNATAPVLQFFDAPCTPTLDVNGIPGPPFSAPVGFTPHVMTADGSNYFGQSQPAVLPVEVCVEQTNAVNPAGQTVPGFFPAPLGDQVFITEALYDPAGRSFSVKATSSDLVVPPTLTVVGYGDISATTGQLIFTPLPAPPEEVLVRSSAGGSNEFQVSTVTGAAGPGTFPVATNDSFTIIEDAATTALNVLTNDTNIAGGTVSLVGLPLLGTAAVNADGTIAYTPKLNASGADGFTYIVTIGTQVTNLASATVNITPVNDPPVAVNDNSSALVNTLIPLDVLANDTDVDGVTNIVAVANLTAPASLGATAVLQANGRIVNFNASLAGTHTFTYQAQDAAGALSNTATVTVTVAGTEAITVVNSFFRIRQSRLRVDGIITPAAGQTVTIDFANAAGAVLGRAGIAVTGPTGVWALDTRGVILPAGTARARITSSNGAVRTVPIIIQ